ncbi:MAG: FAD-dependent oxidoreductase [Xanthobacteraceae bacterium]|nr:FAD-dependent oxidoreductase [Xanthobacteraceae bacterium]
MTEVAVPDHAGVVIIGGGVVGCSVAYHLTRMGQRDVVLLEQGRLTGGTTWHAAGLVGQLRSHPNMTRMVQYSAELYAALEAETGQATGWKPCGSVLVARTPERMALLRRIAGAAQVHGVECHVITPAEAGARYPIMRTDDLAGGLWLPRDGKVNPADVTQALARGARRGGARILEKTRVTAIHARHGRAVGVATTRGDIRADVVVNCAGQWARQLGRKAGVTVPLHSAEHMYIVTGPIAGVTPDLPVLRDPDGYIYLKEEVGGLLVGGFEPEAKPWGMDGIPDDFEFGILPDDWDQFQILMENALVRIPALAAAPVKTFMNGPESFTPDNNFIMGAAPELRNFFVAAGFNSIGIACGGGAGRTLAEWILAGEPPADLWPVDIRRFASFHGESAFLHDRVKEVLGLHYMMPWPNRELVSARPLRTSPLYARLAAKHAAFGSKFGWERPLFFAPSAAEARLDYSFDRQNWFAHAAAEHVATRTGVTLFDLSSFAKLMVRGRAAEATLQRLCANDVAVPPGTTVYTGMLNARGTYESDLTVARLDAETFLVVTGTAQAVRDADWIGRHLPDGVRLDDVTADHAVLAVMGPRARALISRVTAAPLDDAHCPFGAVRRIAVAGTEALALRRSYAGELGFELYVPVAEAGAVYDALFAAGGDLGLRDVGYYALESLRLEKGYRAWGRELTPDTNPFEAGLAFAVRLGKGDFIGRDALLAARAAPPARRLLCFVAEAPDTPLAHGGELVLRDGAPAGEIVSAAYGHTLGALVALGYVRTGNAPVDDAWLAARFEIDVAGARLPVRASLRAPYDPQGTRLKGACGA